MIARRRRKFLRAAIGYALGALTIEIAVALGAGRGFFIVLLIAITFGGVVSMTAIAVWKGLQHPRPGSTNHRSD